MSDTDVVAASIERQNHTVLVVDDNPTTRYATGRALRAAGFKTAEAATGQEALALAAGDVSAVILDVHLPDIDGFEVCRRLRAVPSTAVLPVIHLSAMYVENKHKVVGLDAGADAYLTHPADPPILVATVQALVRARLAEDELRRSEAKFRAIYTQAESGIALIDAGGRIAEANPAMQKMLGRSHDQIAGRSLGDFAAPGQAPTMHVAPAGSEPGAASRREVFAVLRPDGTELYLEWSISPHIEPGLRVGVFANVSARRALEAQRDALFEREQAARIAAERHSRTKDDFIAVLSHELRNPLSAMLMGVQMLQRRGVAPEVGKGLAVIERSVKSQARIISDILDVSRLNSGKLALERGMVDPAALMLTTIDGMRATIDEHRLRIVTDLDAAHEPVWIDATRIQQVLWNILSNAVKFSQPDGEIRVRMTRDDDSLCVSIQDFGRGIEPAFLGTIFDKFAQVASPENRAHGGLGLGLAIVKQLVELHGGTVRADSEGLGAAPPSPWRCPSSTSTRSAPTRSTGARTAPPTCAACASSSSTTTRRRASSWRSSCASTARTSSPRTTTKARSRP
ncbi:MAG: ATP-binding protein [Myxococcota bacterium]